MNKLIKELKDIDQMTCQAMKEWDGVDIAKVPKEYHGYRAILAKVDQILSRHEAEQEEPLAVLADRKGYVISHWGRYESEGCNPIAGWVISMYGHGEDMKTFRYHTNYEAESQARAYLMGLPDKGESK